MSPPPSCGHLEARKELGEESLEDDNHSGSTRTLLCWRHFESGVHVEECWTLTEVSSGSQLSPGLGSRALPGFAYLHEKRGTLLISGW